MRAICFYSDYGYEDDFAGTCRAVMKRLAPNVEIIDVTHGIRARDVLGGALVLRNTLPYMPERAVHLAVVDPGVGGTRRGIVLHSGGGRLFVGPDNGLLALAAEADGGITAAFELSRQELWLSPVSATFHGRDIFAPVAAHLAVGMSPAECGRPIEAADLVRLDLPVARIEDGVLYAAAVLIDRFGNVALNVRREQLQGVRLGQLVELECGGERYHAQVATTFADVRRSDIMVLLDMDSYGQVAVAVNEGSAADVLNVRPGDAISLRLSAL